MAINPLALILQQEELNRKYPGLLAPLPANMAGEGVTVIPPETMGTEPIVATANMPTPSATTSISPADLVPRSLGNLEFAQEVAQANANTEKGMQHKGMFGLKGTLRDVLGILGDSLLVGSGRESVYDKARQREREGDAMAGFTADPAAAAERMTGLNPAAAAKMQDLALTEQLKRQQLASIDQYRQMQMENRRFEMTEKASNVIARIFASPVAKTRPDLAMRQAQEVAARAGVPLDQLGVRPDMSPQEMEMYGSRDMTVNQTMQLPFTERRVKVAETNAVANTTRANRPPVGRAPPATTNIQSYVGEDGYKYTQRSDGSVIKSPTKVKPEGRRSTPRPTGIGAPVAPPGFKYVKKPKQ